MSARSRLAAAGQRAQPGRTRLMVLAITLGVGAVGAITGAQTIVERELSTEFDSTAPPAAELSLGPGASRAVEVARRVPGIVAATARAEYRLRLDGAEGWQQVILIAVEDPALAAVAKAFPEGAGPWPPPPGTVAIERASLSEVDLVAGDRLTLEGLEAGGTVEVSGLAYDPGRNPAWLNGWVVAYAQPVTLADLGLPTAPNRLLIRADADSRDEVRTLADAVVAELAAEGIEARVLAVPEPGKHPAAGVLNTLMYLLSAFGAIAALAAIGLLIALVVAEVRRQLPVIGISKVGGATTRDLMGVFLIGVARVAGLGTLLAIPAGMLGAAGLSAFALTLLNIEVSGWITEPRVFAIQAAVGLAVPLLATVLPVLRLARVPAREALAADASVAARRRPRSRPNPRGGRALQLGWRNAVRQPGRLAVSVIALALGSAASVTAFNTGAAWDRAVDEEFRAQDFLVQAVLAEPRSETEIREAFAAAMVQVQTWTAAELAVEVEGGTSGGPASVLVPPAGWVNPGYELLEGRWLEGPAREAVVTQGVRDPSVAVGDRLRLGDDPEPYLVMGRIRQLSGDQAGVVYVTESPAGLPQAGSANAVRLLDPAGRVNEQLAVDLVGDSGLPVVVAVAGSDAREALDDHLFIITGLLLMLAIAIGVVGLVALVEALATAVEERRAEYAVMKVQGADSRTITRIVRVEALTVAGLALALAVALAAPLSRVVESAVGSVFVGAPLPFVWWWPAIGIAAITTLGIAAAASIIPGYEAADAPAREALAGE